MSNEHDPWVIRTDFLDDAAWEEVCALIAAPQTEDRFLAYVRYVSDKRWQDALPEKIFAALAADEIPSGFCFVIDRRCLTDPEHPVLVLGEVTDWDNWDEAVDEDPPKVNLAFRALPRKIQAIQNNVSIGNMDLEEFAQCADADGVFRDFPRS
ncbi:DUF6924 domain-containing protein [Anatilimnocola floriformis]|uniref:DUF6924 domain-containing protein n=1 Tax=Anatilimnocola floriformis TaxID=2948575 RepID=UPI0020C1FEF0|nr:hypothetical protein [Anatilimnocola floriformis]